MGIFDEQIFPGTEFTDLLGGPDRELWLELFIQADKINPDLAQRLMYLRNTGCRLRESEKFGYVITPISDLWEKSGVKYDQEKQCLIPYRKEIIELLGGLKNARDKIQGMG